MTVSELLSSNDFIWLVSAAYKKIKKLRVKDLNEVVQNTALYILKYTKEIPTSITVGTLVFRSVIYANCTKRALLKNASIFDRTINVNSNIKVECDHNDFDNLDRQDVLEKVAQQLSEKDKKVLIMLLSGNRKTDVANKTGLTRGRIEQIVRKIEKIGRKINEGVCCSLPNGQIQR